MRESIQAPLQTLAHLGVSCIASHASKTCVPATLLPLPKTGCLRRALLHLPNLSTIHPFTLSCQPLQPTTDIIHPHADPVLHLSRPDGILIEANTGLVPFQHAPLQPLASHPDGFPRQLPEQAFPVSPPPELGPHEQVLEVNARRAAPRGIRRVEEGEAGARGRRGVGGGCAGGGR